MKMNSDYHKNSTSEEDFEGQPILDNYEVDFSADINALCESEATLSEEFKQKVETIFEAAIKSKLAEEIDRLEEKYNEELSEAVEETKADISWGSQIRSYVLDSGRIKDLRTGTETGNCSAVLDGNIDIFIEESLKAGV